MLGREIPSRALMIASATALFCCVLWQHCREPVLQFPSREIMVVAAARQGRTNTVMMNRYALYNILLYFEVHGGA